MKILKYLLIFYCVLFFNINIVYPKQRFLTGIGSFNKIKSVYSDCKNQNDKIPDTAFYSYLKVLSQQVDLMNKYNVLNVKLLDDYYDIDENDVDSLISKYCLKIVSSEESRMYTVDYEKIYNENKLLLSPQMLTWLEYLKNNSNIIEDGGLNVKIDNVRSNIEVLENLIEKNQDFIAIKDVYEALDLNAKIYYCLDFDNTPKFDSETNFLCKEYKESYENFLNNNKNSKYYKDVKKYYNKLKKNNFKVVDSPKFKQRYSEIKLKKNEFFESNDVRSQVHKIETCALNEAIEYINYFYDDLNNVCKYSGKENINSLYDATLQDKNTISNSFEKFSDNKNDMAFNKNLYLDAKAFSNQYKESLNDLNNVFVEAYKIYKNYILNEIKNVKINSYTSVEDNRYLNSYKSDIINNRGKQMYRNGSPIIYGYSNRNRNIRFEQFIKDVFESLKVEDLRITISQISDSISYFDKVANEVYKYSYNYEQQRYLTFLSNNGKKIENGDIAEFVYVASYSNPSAKYIYHHSGTSLPLMVFQVLENGVLVKGANYVTNSYYSNTSAPIFIQTTKKYVSNQALQKGTYYVYIGNKTYSTIWGTNTVRQFKEVSKNQVKANFKTKEKLYFYCN